jgi:hypothetical protein
MWSTTVLIADAADKRGRGAQHQTAPRALIAVYVSALNAAVIATHAHRDAEAVLAACWPEQALHDAVAVCAPFKTMNRLVEGLGITAGEDYFKLAAEGLAGG